MNHRQRLRQLRQDVLKAMKQKGYGFGARLIVSVALILNPEIVEDLLDTIDAETGPQSPLTDFFDWLIENWDSIAKIIEYIIGLFG